MQILTFVHHLSEASDDRLDAARRAAEETLRGLGASPGELDLLAAGRAFDLAFDGVSARDAHGALGRRFGGADFEDLRLDFCVQPAEGRHKRLLVADMESTIIENEMLDELAERVDAKDQVAAITARAMNGELDFEQAVRERVALLEGLDAAVLDECLAKIHVDSGARFLLSTLAADGVTTALVSGGFSHFADHVASELGFDHVQANRLEVAGGRLTGRVIEPIQGRQAKVQALEELCRRHGLEPPEAVTVGDGANDLAMLGAAGLGVAYRGKPKVAEAAPQRIDHGDLSTLLYFLGYPRQRWITQAAPRSGGQVPDRIGTPI